MKDAAVLAQLVIGYGNDLRSDDAVGRHVARAVADWQLANVRVLECQQLSPDLALDIASASRVIFVDASIDHTSVTCSPLSAEVKPQAISHHLSPSTLLALAQHLYQAAPEAQGLLIPVASLALGESLSQTAQRGVREALSILRRLLETPCMSMVSPSSS
jgi:hydrogenase maturation protease